MIHFEPPATFGEVALLNIEFSCDYSFVGKAPRALETRNIFFPQSERRPTLDWA
jgi:hypothetical protein